MRKNLNIRVNIEKIREAQTKNGEQARLLILKQIAPAVDTAINDYCEQNPAAEREDIRQAAALGALIAIKRASCINNHRMSFGEYVYRQCIKEIAAEYGKTYYADYEVPYGMAASI